MPKVSAPYHTSGLSTVYLVMLRRSDGAQLTDLIGTFATPPQTAPYLVENATAKQNYETNDMTLANGIYDCYAYVRQGAAQDAAVDLLIWRAIGVRVSVSAWVDESVPTLAEMLAGGVGTDKNVVFDDFLFDAYGQLSTCKKYYYDSSAHATTHDKATGLLRTATVTASHTLKLPTVMKEIDS